MSLVGLLTLLATAGAAREKHENHAAGERQHGRERGPSADAELGMKESAFVVDGIENDLRGRGEKHTPKIAKSMDMTTNEVIAARPARREPMRLAGMPVPQLDREASKAIPPAIGCSNNKLVGEGLARRFEGLAQVVTNGAANAIGVDGTGSGSVVFGEMRDGDVLIHHQIVDAVPKAAEGDGGISGRTDLVHVDFEDGEVFKDWGGDRGDEE
ncbi:MAG: hypothetical protein M1836_005033 [Candelina mexicana]|nr:MAG: hypothetical protein M1836_005033 [Candelina mexicana]